MRETHLEKLIKEYGYLLKYQALKQESMMKVHVRIKQVERDIRKLTREMR